MKLAVLRNLVLKAGGRTVLGRTITGWSPKEDEWASETVWAVHLCLYCRTLLKTPRDSIVSLVERALEGVRWFNEDPEAVGLNAILGICDHCYQVCVGLECRICSRTMRFSKPMRHRYEALLRSRTCEVCSGISTSSIKPRHPSRQELKDSISVFSRLLGDT